MRRVRASTHQAPKRRRGRLAPLNGSVTRADIRAIYRDFISVPADPPTTIEEFVDYLCGAIVDPVPSPRARAKMAAAARAREARRRADQARSRTAATQPRALAAA